MNRRTEIPAYDLEVFARELESAAHRITRVPASYVDSAPTKAKLDLDAIPVWVDEALGTALLDHRVAFLMLNIDGVSSFETVIRLSHVPEAEAIPALEQMLESGLIAILGEPRRSLSSVPAPAARFEDVLESGVWSRPKIVGDEHWAFRVESNKKDG
jgi:hypothetical protein